MNDVKSQTRSLFACISDENGMWMYAGLHRDLADAVIGYAKEASMPIGTHYQSDGFTWYKFNLPPENWEDWNGTTSTRTQIVPFPRHARGLKE